jgi:signal peptidase I
MSPTFLPGDRFLARKLMPRDHVPKRGDLIVYNNPTPTGAAKFIGRVVAIAGDHLKIHGDQVLINGKELERDPVPAEGLTFLGDQMRGRVSMEVNSGHRYLVAYGDTSNGRRALGEFDATIPSRHVFILGDNRERAKDSRHFGTIPLADVIGHVEYIYWPSESWSRFGVANDQLP